MLSSPIAVAILIAAAALAVGPWIATKIKNRPRTTADTAALRATWVVPRIAVAGGTRRNLHEGRDPSATTTLMQKSATGGHADGRLMQRKPVQVRAGERQVL
jgi:hypothetical protein